jgi:hypothetical protein
MLYRLKRGAHCDGSGFHAEGSLVESSEDLVAAFGPEKFEEISKVGGPIVEWLGDLEDLTTNELRELAKGRRIDVEGIDDRSKILGILSAISG